MIVQHYVCDRCKHSTVESMNTCKLSESFESKTLHLCNNCTEELQKWLKEVPKVTEQVVAPTSY